MRRLYLQRHARDATASNCKSAIPLPIYTDLLDDGDPIEAYCEFCDECWTVSLQKRIGLSEFVAAACGDAPPAPRTLEDGQ
jgi:hypothetical protein